MTRNEQLLLIMSWARSFHGLSLEDTHLVAERVLDDRFGGSISDAHPVDVMKTFDELVYAAVSQGDVFPGDHTVPTYEDFGLVRPPLFEGVGAAVLSDNTVVVAGAMAHVPLPLASGGVVPIISEEQRDVIFPIVFSDPSNITQETIDELVENTPNDFVPQSFVEQTAVEVYQALKESAATDTEAPYH